PPGRSSLARLAGAGRPVPARAGASAAQGMSVAELRGTIDPANLVASGARLVTYHVPSLHWRLYVLPSLVVTVTLAPSANERVLPAISSQQPCFGWVVLFVSAPAE